MILQAPKGMTSVSAGGTEYKVKQGVVEIPDEFGKELLQHGLTVMIPDEPDESEPPNPPADLPKAQDKPPKVTEESPKPTDDKKKSESSTSPVEEKPKNDTAAGGDKNGK